VEENPKKQEMGIFDKIFSKKEPVQNSEKLMDENQFWEIIHTTKKNSSGNYEKQNSDAWHRGGLIRSSDEISIMEMEQRGELI